MPSNARIGWTIVGYALLGIAIVAVIIMCVAVPCNVSAPGALCKAVLANPPWTLLSATAAAPCLLATWFWRTTQKFGDARLASHQQFLAALDLLGSKEQGRMIGGIYALEQLATLALVHTSTVIERIALFVRQHTAQDPDPDQNHNLLCEPPMFPVQIALSVLGRLHKSDPHATIDLRDCDLEYASFVGNFDGAQFDHSWLRGATFAGASLKSASFKNASLVQADFTSCVSAEGANWDEANRADSIANPEVLRVWQAFAKSRDSNNTSK